MPKLYLLTNDDPFELLIKKLEAAFSTGTIKLVQIRRKKTLKAVNGADALYDEAVQIIALAERYGVDVVINDDIELAAKLGVGVHLGQSDGSIIDARQRLSADQIIGRTCHDQVELVVKAKTEGASYAAMGAVFTSGTKPNAIPIERDALLLGAQQDIDICIIGGLTVENVTALKGLPIAYIAVVGDIMSLTVDDIADRCLQWQKILERWYSD